MSDFRIDKITNRDGSAGTQIAGITTFSGTSGMVMPGGPTEYRGGRGRGIVAGGRNNPSPAAAILTIDKIEIATTGNATDFGDLAVGNTGIGGGAGSSTRAILAGGFEEPASARTSRLQYVVMSSQGGAIEFGNLVGPPKNGIVCGSNNTRGIFQGGATPTYTSDMTSINLQSLGSDSSYGSALEGAIRNGACANSTTRGLFGAGQGPSANYSTIVTYLFATRGSGIKFGNLSNASNGIASVSNTTRGVWAGGITPTVLNTIEYVTMATEGNATDFGDLTVARRNMTGTSNSTRGTWSGGHIAASGQGDNLNTIDYITIATTGNAVDFGDLTVVRRCSNCGGSDAHGGLG